MERGAVTLEQLQRWAQADAKRLGLEGEVVVRWGGEAGGDGRGGKACIFRGALAHAHVGAVPMQICILRGRAAQAMRETIRHEVAHFAPKGKSHGWGHIETQAKLGSKNARRVLVSNGRARCPKHSWRMLSTKTERLTRAGLVVTYEVECRVCRKVVG